MVRVRLGAAIAARLADEGAARRPAEACGLLGGRLSGGDDAEVTSFHPLVNRASPEAAPKFFVVGPEAMTTIDAIEDAGETFLAIWHSHVRTPAVPSRTDREFAAGWGPDVLWVLSSLAGGEATPRAWRVDAGAATELTVTAA